MTQAAPLTDLGGRGPVLHLAHANGFPPGTYQPLADVLAQHSHIMAVPARPLWPGAEPSSAPTWRLMAKDLSQSLDHLGLKAIVGVGHSLGAVLTMWAAIDRPDLFRALVLIDPVLLPPTRLFALRLMRALGLQQQQPLVQGARRRRRNWPNELACYQHFRQKPLFARWPDDSLRCYVECSTRPSAEGGIELIYPPEWEAHIFATVPVDVWHDVPKLKTPALIISGQLSDTFLPPARARLAQFCPSARWCIVPDAGHLVPMERPVETGNVIIEFLSSG
jgi:pimeloyl-ACP methyl ester carboxylesterase